MIYKVLSAERLDENDAMHEDLVRDTIVHGDLGPDFAILENILERIYDEDLRLMAGGFLARGVRGPIYTMVRASID